MGYNEGFCGHPWDNPVLRAADELNKERCQSEPRLITKSESDKKEHTGLSDKELLEHYRRAISNVESYVVCTIKNLWSLMQKKPRSEHQALLNEIYALEDMLFFLQKEQAI